MMKGAMTMAGNDEAERMALGERLREARDYLDFSQDEVAEVVGISRSAVSLIESGQRKVEVLELKRFAALFDRPIEFFTGELTPSVPEANEILALARAAKKLSTKDVEELQRFAEFLQSRSEGTGGRKDE
jgi:transcriptional regulator with XRE-family HTH domain